MIDTPTWFGPHDRSLFGWFCTPDSGAAGYGILLCPPIGEEEHNAHETIRRTAWRLADHGIASLRFDYHGTGDSMGQWSDPARVDAWLTSIADAYDALVATGVARIGGLGMRIGATLLASTDKHGRADFDMLVLWDPCSGKSMLREGYARRPSSSEYDDGSIETPGYLYGPRTVTDLQAIDPATLPTDITVRKTLVLNRDDRPPVRGLRKRFPPSEAVDWQTCAGLSDMLDVPMDTNTVPTSAVEQVVNWIAQQTDQIEPTELKVDERALDLPQPGGEPLVESTVRLGDTELFGIRTEPAERTREATVVFVNVANDRQTGPGRHWVDMARTLASEGFGCLRLSQSGTGDSPTRSGQTFGELYCSEWLTDLPDALADPQLPSGPLALISLCSGAYSSLEAAMRVPVAVVYPINVILTIPTTARGQRCYSTDRQVARPPTRAFHRHHLSHPKATAAAWRIYRQFTVWNHPMAAVRALIRRGTAIVLVMSTNDGRHFRESLFWTAFFAHRWSANGLFRLSIDSRIDHPLMTQTGQRTAVAVIRADLHERFPESGRHSPAPLTRNPS